MATKAAEVPAEVLAGDIPPGLAGADDKAANDMISFMRDHFAKQDKFPVRLQEDQWVQINGYTFIIKGGERVKVPEDVYNVLADAGLV